MSDFGYVYCMTNNCMPDMCKIGCIYKKNKTSQDRANELYLTNTPDKFKVVFDIKVKNPSKYETLIHKKLADKRYNKSREFFVCNPDEIIDMFLMKNLIVNDSDKFDFDQNYFNTYIDNNKKVYATNDNIKITNKTENKTEHKIN